MILILTTSDTDILALSEAIIALPPGFSETRVLNPTAMVHDQGAFDRFLSQTLPKAEMVLVRLLGGERGMGSDFDRLAAACRQRHIPLVTCSGEPQRDASFEARSTTPGIIPQTSFEYLNHGGVANLTSLLRFLSDEILGTGYGYEPPQPLPQDGIYRPGRMDAVPLEEYRRQHCDPERPTAALLFYRAH